MRLTTLTLENYRAFEFLRLELDETTVLIGENNTGKTSVLEALRACLASGLGRRRPTFELYDHRIESPESIPGATPLRVTLDFAESEPGEWPEAVLQDLADVIAVHDDETSHVTLQVTSTYSEAEDDFATEWSFLNPDGDPLPGKAKSPTQLNKLQQSCPVFYLSAMRDSKDFAARSSFWGPFLRNPAMDTATRQMFEKELVGLNDRIIDAHDNLQKVKANLSKTRRIVDMGSGDPVGIEALPARLSDMLNRAQVTMATGTGVKIPLGRHGAGTQSLSVMFLFEAFAETMLAGSYGTGVQPILALEEPEAHLHPSAVRALWSLLEGMGGQKIIATHSGDLLSEIPLTSLRRFSRENGATRVWSLSPGVLEDEEERKLRYVLQISHGELMFARCWILVEGETDHLALHRAARALDMRLEEEGVRIVPFKDFGTPTVFVKVATALGIQWVTMVDGDAAGKSCVGSMESLVGHEAVEQRAIVLPHTIEVLACEHGFGEVYEKNIAPQKASTVTAKTGDDGYWLQVCSAQSRLRSKPALMSDVMDLMDAAGADSVPAPLSEVLQRAIDCARG